MTRRASALASSNLTLYPRMLRPSLTTLCRTVASLLVVTATISIASPAALAHEPGPAPSAITDMTYVVKAGDYLAGIAKALGVKLTELLALNHITASSAIHPGDKLKVPAGGLVPEAANLPSLDTNGPSAPGVVYTVEVGDYLSRIARTLGVSLANLLAVNHLTRSSLLAPGDRIFVPKGGSEPAAAAQPPATGCSPPAWRPTS